MSLSYSDCYVLVVSLPFRGVSCSVPCFPLLNIAFFWKGLPWSAHFECVLGSTLWLGQHLVPPQRCESDAYNATDYDILSSFIHLRCVRCFGSTAQQPSRVYSFYHNDIRKRALPQRVYER